MKFQRTMRFLCALLAASAIFAISAHAQILIKTPEMQRIWEPKDSFNDIRALSPDGQTFAVSRLNRSNSRSTIEMQTLGGGTRVLQPTNDEPQYATRGAFSPDGTRFASLRIVYPEAKMYVTLWDFASAKQLAVWSDAPDREIEYRLDWTSAGLALWRYSDGNKPFAQLLTFDSSALQQDQLKEKSRVNFDIEATDVTNMAVSPDRRLVACQSGARVLFFDAATGKARDEWKTPLVITGLKYASAAPLIFAPDSRFILAGMRVWNVENGQSYELQGDFDDARNAFAWSPDGTLIFGTGQQVRLWNAQNGRLLGGYQMPDISQYSKPLAFFDADGRAATSVNETAIIRWDIAKLRILNRVLDSMQPFNAEVQTSKLNARAFGNDYGFGIGGSEQNPGSWTVRDASTGRVLGALPSNLYRGWPEYTTFAIAPGGRIVAKTDVDRRTGNTQILLYDVANQRSLLTLRVAKDPVHQMQFSPDGQWLATNSANQRIRVFSLKNGELKQLWRIQIRRNARNAQVAELSEKTRRSWGALAWSPDSKSLAAPGAAGTLVQIFDVASGRVTRRLRSENPFVAQRLAWSHDGKTIALGGSPLRIWDLRNGRLGRALHPYKQWGYKLDDSSTRYVAFARDGQSLFAGENVESSLRWDLNWLRAPLHDDSLQTFVLPAALPDSANGVNLNWDSADVEFSADGRLLGASGRDDFALWNLDDGKLLQRFLTKQWLSFASDKNAMIAVSDTEETRFDIATGRVSTRVLGNSRDIALSASEDKSSPLKNPLRLRLTDASFAVFGQQRGMAFWLEAPSWSQAKAMSPDGKTVAATSNDKAWLWEISTGKRRQLENMGDARFVNICFSPDGQRVAAANLGGFIPVWDVQSGRLLHILSSHTAAALSVAWSYDSRKLASGGEDNTVRVWDVESGKLQRTFDGHQDAVLAVAWSPDGRRIASRSQDGTVKLWSAP